MNRALIGRTKTASPFLRNVKTTKTAVFLGLADADEALFLAGMFRIGKYAQGASEDTFDVPNGKAMLRTLLAIARVPIELQAIDPHRSKDCCCTYNCQHMRRATRLVA